MLRGIDIMLERPIKDYYSKTPFNECNLPIFEEDCKDDGCKLTGHFNDYIILNGDNIKTCLKLNEKSVDRIIFLKKAPNKIVDVILCELTSGEKRYTDVIEKIKKSGEYILNVLNKLGFKIRKFKCIFVGKYKNANRVKEKPFSIPYSGKNNLVVKKLSCGNDFSLIT